MTDTWTLTRTTKNLTRSQVIALRAFRDDKTVPLMDEVKALYYAGCISLKGGSVKLTERVTLPLTNGLSKTDEL